MALADKLVMSDETAKGLVNGIKVGGLWGRIGVYVVIGVPVGLVALLMYTISYTPPKIAYSSTEIFFGRIIFLLIITIPFILTELLVRSWRRKNGFSVNGNITEEIKQREVNVMVAREEKARAKVGGDSKNLDYWFGMMEKGAITKEEYEKKKMELL